MHVRLLHMTDMCVFFMCWCMLSIWHACDVSFQGDVGFPGPPGISGPPVREIHFSLQLIHANVYSPLINNLCCWSLLPATIMFHKVNKSSSHENRNPAILKWPKLRGQTGAAVLLSTARPVRIVNEMLPGCYRYDTISLCLTLTVLFPSLWLTGEARHSWRVRDPRRAGEHQLLTLFELSIHSSLLYHCRLTLWLPLFSDRVRGGRSERQDSQAPKDPKVSL